MKNAVLCAFGAALALTFSVPAAAQGMSSSVHHDDRGRADDHRDGGMHKDQYGSWNSSWGARPGVAPKHWTKKSDWYRHVRACERKYRSYNWRTDTYRIGKKALRCRL